VTLAFEIATRMPAPVAAHSSSFAGAGHSLQQPILWLLGLFLFLYVSCEVGVWNWLPQHLIAQGIPKSRALNVLSMGFALGLLLGRVLVSPVLIHVPATTVLLFASAAMAVTTYFMLRTGKPGLALALVAVAGVSMAPVFPTTLAVVGDVFPAVTGTATGFAITCGWIGLAVSSRTIGAIAGGDALRLRKALLLIPASAVLMAMMSLIMIALHTR
jgi:fucose permease